MDTLLYLVGFGLLFFFIFGSETLISIYREKQQMRHIENIIANLPENDRVQFAKEYLDERAAQLKKTENPFYDFESEYEK